MLQQISRNVLHHYNHANYWHLSLEFLFSLLFSLRNCSWGTSSLPIEPRRWVLFLSPYGLPPISRSSFPKWPFLLHTHHRYVYDYLFDSVHSGLSAPLLPTVNMLTLLVLIFSVIFFIFIHWCVFMKVDINGWEIFRAYKCKGVVSELDSSEINLVQ